MKKPVLALGSPVAEPYYAKICELFDVVEVSQVKTPGSWPSKDVLLKDCMGAEVIIVEPDPIDRDMLIAWQNAGLKLLICTRGNPVNVDADACRELGIPLVYTPGRNAQSVAEQTVAMMLMVAKHMQVAVRHIADGTYLDEAVENVYDVPPVKDVVWMNDRVNVYNMIPMGGELYGKTLGVMGFGAIGRKVGQMARAFGMEVRAYDPYCPKESVEKEGAAYCGLDEALDSDFVSIHLPVLDSTRGIVNEEWFNKMKKGAYFINTARAAVVDQKAMVEALESGHLAGAAVDVMWQEPCPKNHPLLKMENVLITPHIAGNTVDIETWQSRMVMEELEAYLAGKPQIRVKK